MEPWMIKSLCVFVGLMLIGIKFKKQIMRLVSGTSALVSAGAGATPASSPATTGAGGTSRKAWSIAVGVIGLGLVVWGLVNPQTLLKTLGDIGWNSRVAVVIACIVLSTLIAINSWPKNLYWIVWVAGVALMLTGWASGSKTAEELAAEKERVAKIALAPASVPKPSFAEVPEADKRCAADWCTPRLLADGSTERVSVRRHGVCWDHKISKLPELNLKVSYRGGAEKSCTSLPCGTFDTFRFTPEKGVDIPSHRLVPSGRADLC